MASSCWFPDGRTNGSSLANNFVPCDPSAAHSACCAAGETCVGHNLCLSENGLMYRGGCTDKTFTNEACPSLCTEQTGPNAGSQNEWTFLKPCDASTGKLQWVCDLNNDCGNSSLRFNLQVGGPKEVNITGTINASPTTATQASATSSSPSPSNTSECISKSGVSTAVVAVGAGVGISLGVLLLLALFWGFWERRKRKMAPMTPAVHQPQLQQQPHQDYSPVPVMENKYPPQVQHEVPGTAATARSELSPGPPEYIGRNELA